MWWPDRSWQTARTAGGHPSGGGRTLKTIWRDQGVFVCDVTFLGSTPRPAIGAFTVSVCQVASKRCEVNPDRTVRGSPKDGSSWRRSLALAVHFTSTNSRMGDIIHKETDQSIIYGNLTQCRPRLKEATCSAKTFPTAGGTAHRAAVSLLSLSDSPGGCLSQPLSLRVSLTASNLCQYGRK